MIKLRFSSDTAATAFYIIIYGSIEQYFTKDNNKIEIIFL